MALVTDLLHCYGTGVANMLEGMHNSLGTAAL